MKKRTALDLGASTIRVIPHGEEEILSAPAVVALDCTTASPICFGQAALLDAARMPGSLDLLYPLLTPDTLSSSLLEGIFASASAYCHRSGRFRSDVILSLPASISGNREEYFLEAACAMGAKDVFVIGALHAVMKSLPEEIGLRAILHVGASVSEIGFYDGEELVASHVVRMAGHALDDLVGDFIYDRFEVLLDARGAEEVKIRLGNLEAGTKTIEVAGIARRSGLPCQETIDTTSLYDILSSAYGYFTSPMKELAAKVGQEPLHILLSGGSAPVAGLVDAVKAAFPRSTVEIVDQPADAVVRGIREIIDCGDLDGKPRKKKKEPTPRPQKVKTPPAPSPRRAAPDFDEESEDFDDQLPEKPFKSAPALEEDLPEPSAESTESPDIPETENES